MAQNPDFNRDFNDLKNYIPHKLRNPQISALVDNLFNRFLTHDESVPLYGYVGRKPSSTDDRTQRIPEVNAERDINAIIPVLSFKVGNDLNTFTVQDLIKKAAALGIQTDNLDWLYSQGNNFVPPINLDKFTNFFNYYWIARSVDNAPDMPWNPELSPEYYTIANPSPSNKNKKNVSAASTKRVILTGTGFNNIVFTLTFTSPTSFTLAVNGILNGYKLEQVDFALTNQDEHFDIYVNNGSDRIKLIEFNITREFIYDQFGESIGLSSFEAGDVITITPTLLSRNYTTSFKGKSGIKGKVNKVKPLNVYQTIDNVLLRNGDRVLIKNNSAVDDGIYIVRPGEWERAPDFNAQTSAPQAQVFVAGGNANGQKMFESFSNETGPGYGWKVLPNVSESNTNNWQEGNYWVSGDELNRLNIGRSEAIQAVRPIIEYSADIQLNSYVKNGLPADSGDFYKQIKTEFNQLPLFDLYRYDGTHSNLVSSVFYYDEDLTGRLDVSLQRRVDKSNNDSADFVFNHGLMDENNNLLFIKRNGKLKTIWEPGYSEPTLVDVQYGGAGNGKLSKFEPLGFTQQQVWTLTALTNNTFEITGSKMASLPSPYNVISVGEPYSNGEFNAFISRGNIDFEPGDTFLVRVGNLETPRYVKRDASHNLVDVLGEGAYQIPRTFYNNPYNESRSEVSEGALYSHFRGILTNQIDDNVNYSFGGSIKLWSEQQTLLASLLMQRDMTPISIIDLAQRQYENALNTVKDIYQQNIIQYLADNGNVSTLEKLELLFEYIQNIRKSENDVKTVLFDSTSPVLGFPITLPQLGISNLVKPQIKFDNKLGKVLLTHHDGHKSPLIEDDFDFRQNVLGNFVALQIKRSDNSYTLAIGSFTSTPVNKPYKGEIWAPPGNPLHIFDVDSDNLAPSNPINGTTWYHRAEDTLFVWQDGWVKEDKNKLWKPIDLASTLNSLTLYIENKLYYGINPNARKYDFSALESDIEFHDQLKKELFLFASTNAYDPLGSDYIASDAFTWNYSKADKGNFPALSDDKVPARWFNVLLSHQRTVSGVIPTERPNLEPWKLFNFTDATAWWNSLTAEKKVAYTAAIQPANINSNFTHIGSVKVVNVGSKNTDLNGLPLIDGIQLITGDKVLLTSEDFHPNNTIWTVGMGAWTKTQVSPGNVITITSGEKYKNTTWVILNDQVGQARMWSTQMWADIKLLHPTLKLSVNEYTDELLPPYVSKSLPHAVNALTTALPPGPSLSYEYNSDSPVEAVWKESLEYGYAKARALFRFDPLAFLGFCWGYNWVEVDNILYDGMDVNMPGHKRFKLHGDTLNIIERSQLELNQVGNTNLVITYDAYDSDRKQNFTVMQNNLVLGYIQEGSLTSVAGYSFTIEDEGKPFRIGDRFEITPTGATFIPVLSHKFLGFGQVFTHALRETSIDTSSSYAVSAYREWDINMGYRAGGLVNTDDLNVFTDNDNLSDTGYSLVFKKNQIARDEWIQALRITVLQLGEHTDAPETGYIPKEGGEDWVFRIEGYNPRYLELTYYEMEPNKSVLTFNALGKEHTSREWHQPTIKKQLKKTNLPLVITGLQNVVNFLFGYSLYLEERGWDFSSDSSKIDAETGRARTFQLEVEKLIDRCYAGIKLEQGHVINPFLDGLQFIQKKGLLSEFTDTSLFDITGHAGIFDVFGSKFKKADLNILRTNGKSSVVAEAPMFSAHVQLDEFEHVFIFNNYAQPSIKKGILYDPFSASRVVTYRFNGRKQSTDNMRPEFGGHFLKGNTVHQNIQASADNIADFYNANKAFENETTTKHAMALLGFNEKQYFNDLDISNKTQFNFWRGLIQSKGTNLSIEAYLNNNRFEDAKVDEYWAYKAAEYGDARQKTFPELKLSISDALTQFTQLQFDPIEKLSAYSEINRFDESRWFTIDDMDQDAYYIAEPVGSFNLQAPQIGQLYELPFVADKLISNSGNYTQINSTKILATGGPISIIGYGPAKPRFNPVKLFNYVENELVAEIPVWHPAANIHTPAALESINIISDQNPAKYNYSTLVINNNSYDPLRVWGEKEVGRVWFDTRNLSYIPYYDDIIFKNRDERLSRWGTLADYSTVDVYEWVRSTVPPSEYDALAESQAGNADLADDQKAAGKVADKQNYVRERNWYIRPIAWSYSPIPVEFKHESFNSSFSGNLNLISKGKAWLDVGTFDQYGVVAGMRIGAWKHDDVDPKPLSEYIVLGNFGLHFDNTMSDVENVGLTNPLWQTFDGIVEVTSTNSNVKFTGQLLFTPITERVPVLDENGLSTGDYNYSFFIKVTEVGSGDAETFLINSALGEDGAKSNPPFNGRNATVGVIQNSSIVVDMSRIGFNIRITPKTTALVDAGYAQEAIVEALNDSLIAYASVELSEVVVDPSIASQGRFINDKESNEYNGVGWVAWNIPTQAQLTNDSRQPVSSWKPYIGDFVSQGTNANLIVVQDAINENKNPLTLNNNVEVRKYKSEWSEWKLLENTIMSGTALNDGEFSLVNINNIDQDRLSVYVNGISQLKAAYTVNGQTLTLKKLSQGSEVTAIIRKYEPTSIEFNFNPTSNDDLSYQQHYKQDYEYVTFPVRDRDGALSSNLYYFWVRDKPTAATGKKMSTKSIQQELIEGPTNFLTFQHMIGDNNAASPLRYDAITISGLNYIVTKDDTFKLRFTRNFTLRVDPEDLNLKNTHTEWRLMRPGQRTRISESLWLKLTDSVAGVDSAGNDIPAIRRVLYDERNNTRTRFGFNNEQTLAPAELLRSSITYTIVNTSLMNTTGRVPVPDYISFLDLSASDEWFNSPANARKTMTDIWNQANVAQINEIFFAALNDILANNYELIDIFKTSRLSAYSIKVVPTSPIAQTFE
jgi:hypothetical protein